MPLAVAVDGSTEDYIPWKFCNTLLSVIRNPQFNPMEVTFESCGEMLSRAASRREEGWSNVSGRTQATIGPSPVILLGVLDSLKDEMQQALDIERWGAIDQKFNFVGSRFSSEGFRRWKETLRNIALVHPSWYTHVRRLLGYGMRSRNGGSPNLIQNPLFGGWTQELHMSFDTLLESGVHHSLLPTLCARVCNVRLVSFSLTKYTKNADSLVELICKGLSVLTKVEEVIFLGDAVPNELIALVAETQHSTLQIARFALQNGCFKLESERFPQVISPLASLPSLRVIEVALSDSFALGKPSFARFGTVSAVSWSRNPTESGSQFSLDHLCYQWRPVDIPARDIMLRSVRHVEIDLFIMGNFDRGDNVSAAISKSCSDYSSACQLTLQKSRGPGFGLAHFALCLIKANVHPSVQELVLITTLAPSIPSMKIEGKEDLIMTRVAQDDERLSEALGSQTIPGLRAVRVLLREQLLPSQFLRDITEGVARSSGETEITSDARYVYLLPQCMRKCKERGVTFTVDILFEKESWH